MQPPAATKFQERLLAGEWEGALDIIPSLLHTSALPASQEALRDARCARVSVWGLFVVLTFVLHLFKQARERVPWSPMQRALRRHVSRFLIRQQQYLEALAAGNTGLALDVLRNELAPLAGEQHVPRLHHLASACACTDVDVTDVLVCACIVSHGGGLCLQALMSCPDHAAGDHAAGQACPLPLIHTRHSLRVRVFPAGLIQLSFVCCAYFVELMASFLPSNNSRSHSYPRNPCIRRLTAVPSPFRE
jgi:hypothetical protein